MTSLAAFVLKEEHDLRSFESFRSCAGIAGISKFILWPLEIIFCFVIENPCDAIQSSANNTVVKTYNLLSASK